MRAAEAATLRALRVEDVEALVALSATLGGHETVADWRHFTSRHDGVAIGAEVDGRLVGYAAGDIRVGFGLGDAAGWLDAFGVELAWRGRGVGRALAGALLAELRLRGARRAFTLVAPHDASLLPFLREMGFRDQQLTCIGRDL